MDVAIARQLVDLADLELCDMVGKDCSSKRQDCEQSVIERLSDDRSCDQETRAGNQGEGNHTRAHSDNEMNGLEYVDFRSVEEFRDIAGLSRDFPQLEKDHAVRKTDLERRSSTYFEHLKEVHIKYFQFGECVKTEYTERTLITSESATSDTCIQQEHHYLSSGAVYGATECPPLPAGDDVRADKMPFVVTRIDNRIVYLRRQL